jgi:integrase
MDTRSARAALTKRREPYWTVISSGCAIGYRKGAKGGTWVARFRGEDGKQHYESIGAADDAPDANEITVFSFTKAQELARQFFDRMTRQENGHVGPSDAKITVSDALAAYFGDREQRGSKGLAKDRAAAKARIIPILGEIELGKLTTKRMRDWQTNLVTAPPLRRAPAGKASGWSEPTDVTDADAVRARRATANRTLTVLKAALNHAFHEGRVASDDAWRKVKPFRGADTPVVHYLSEDECRRIVNAAVGAFRDMIRAALVTGCRYGELTRIRVADFNADAGVVTVRESKSGKPRHIVLTDEGRALFVEATIGKDTRDIIFLRDDGKKWGPSHQQRPLEAASARAGIKPAATFHILRHTYASSLAMRGVPMGVIAAQLGHADTRMTEKHYAHLSPNYVAETIRAALPALGIVERSNVRTLAAR